jgi:hypothetical protein
MHVIGVNDEEIREGMRNGTIASTVADSGAMSRIGMENNHSKRTGKPSTKEFILSNGDVVPASEIAEYLFNIRKPAKELHITPGISQNLLLSKLKYAYADYITVFEKDRVNVYDDYNTMITVSREAVLRGRARGQRGSMANPDSGDSTQQQHGYNNCQQAINRIIAQQTGTK